MSNISSARSRWRCSAITLAASLFSLTGKAQRTSYLFPIAQSESANKQAHEIHSSRLRQSLTEIDRD